MDTAIVLYPYIVVECLVLDREFSTSLQSIKSHLIFDARCSTCSSLAKTVKETVGNKLESISIHDPKAQDLLDQVYPDGWIYAPYLVITEKNKVKASKGFNLFIQLGWLIGLRGAWRIWNLSRTQNLSLPIKIDAIPARRQLLKLLAGIGIATASGMLTSVTPAYACVPCQSCDGTCYYNGCTGNPNCSPWISGRCSLYRCYDDQTGEFCFEVLLNCCCNCGGCA